MYRVCTSLRSGNVFMSKDTTFSRDLYLSVRVVTVASFSSFLVRGFL